MKSLPASHRIIKNFNSIETLYTITITYVTFAEMWSGRYCVIATDYDRYFILKICPPNSNKRKYVPCGRFKYMINRTILAIGIFPESDY